MVSSRHIRQSVPVFKTNYAKTGSKVKASHALTFLIAAGVMLTASPSLRADDTKSSSEVAATPPALSTDNENNNTEDMQEHQHGLYHCNELSLDAFGTASLGRYTIEHLSNSRVRHNTEVGAGVGINYFITRNLGIGADMYSENIGGPFIDSGEANLILRLPLGHSGFAPYIFGGGGDQFDMAKTWFGQAGIGLEYRFARHMGLFVDARGVLPDETKCYGVSRLGLRFVF